MAARKKTSALRAPTLLLMAEKKTQTLHYCNYNYGNKKQNETTPTTPIVLMMTAKIKLKPSKQTQTFHYCN